MKMEVKQPVTKRRKQAIRVLLISPFPPPPGGIGRWAVLISEEARCRNNVVLIPLDISPRWREVDDLRIWKRVIGGGLQFLRDFLRFLLLLRFLPDVVHLNGHGQLATFRDIPILALCRLFRIPSVYHVRFGRIPEIAPAKTNEWRRVSLILRLASKVVAIDRSTQDTINKFLPNVETCLIPNCINFPLQPNIKPADEVKPYFVFLGLVIPTKGIKELVQAWSELAPANFQLRIIGPGNLSYKQKLLSKYPSDSIEFVGELPHEEAIQMLSSSEGLILPSFTEGFPNVVIEAMALGKAVLSTNVGAIPDMLDDGCGIVVEARSVDQLKKGLTILIQNPDIRISCGKRAKSKVQAKYVVSKVFDVLLQTWMDVSKL